VRSVDRVAWSDTAENVHLGVAVIGGADQQSLIKLCPPAPGKPCHPQPKVANVGHVSEFRSQFQGSVGQGINCIKFTPEFTLFYILDTDLHIRDKCEFGQSVSRLPAPLRQINGN
jgi:hypothetical protein